MSRFFELKKFINFVKVANFNQGENTQIFAEKFPDLEDNKGWADRFYTIFNTWKEYDRYRELLNSFNNSEDIINFIEKCEKALGKITPEITRLGLPEAVAFQYIHKFHPELLTENGEFYTRLEGIQDKASFFSLLRGGKKKEEIPPEFEGTNFKNFDKETREWMLKVFVDKTEAHSAQDIVSMAEAFKRSGDKLQKKVWEFGSYSQAQRYLDENSGISEAAYIESIRIPAQEGDMSRVIYEDERWKVVLIGSTIGGQWWRYATRADPGMCIGTLNNNLFARYSVQGGVDPYFIIDKQDRQGSNPMRMFTISTQRSENGSVEISEDESTMTDANNRGIDLQSIQGYLGSDFQEIKNVILNDARSRKETLGKQNADKANELIKNRETAIQNIPQIKKLIPEFIANGKTKDLLSLGDETIRKGVAENFSRNDYRKFFKFEFEKIYPDLAKIAAKNMAENNPSDFFYYFDEIQAVLGEADAKVLALTAAQNMAEKDPDGIFHYFIQIKAILGEAEAKRLAPSAAQNLAEKDPSDFFDYLSKIQAVLGEAEIKVLAPSAVQNLAGEDPGIFFYHFNRIQAALGEEEAKRLAPSVATNLAKNDPDDFFHYFIQIQALLGEAEANELKQIAESKQKTASSKSKRFNKIARYLRLAKIG